jgi:anti-sigma factor ChrR (cupin superfamily)
MASNAMSKTIVISDLEWQPAMPGVRMKHLWSHPETKRRAVISRFEPGAKLPMHRHIGDEILYVIEGSIADESGTLTAGNMGFRPNGCVHNVSSKNGATVYAVITGGVEPANEIGSAPGSQIFLLSEIPWIESPILPGARQKTILEDNAMNRRVIVARFEPDTRLPRHRHIGEELIYMLEGAHGDEFSEITAGNFNYRTAGCAHGVSSKNGATWVAVIYGGVEPA